MIFWLCVLLVIICLGLAIYVENVSAIIRGRFLRSL